MKGRGILITIISIALVFTLTIFICFLLIRASLIKMDKEVTACWTELYDLTTKKNQFLRNSLRKYDNTKEISHFQKMLLDNLNVRKSYKKYCQLDYIYLEYNLNKSLIRIKSLNESFFKKNEVTITKIDSIVNIKIDVYNNHVQSFNEYYTLFPNIIVAKYLSYSRKAFFTIKYGVDNDDPIVKSKEVPEWARDVDTTFLSK